jgi:hypothetical protein
MMMSSRRGLAAILFAAERGEAAALNFQVIHIAVARRLLRRPLLSIDPADLDVAEGDLSVIALEGDGAG